MTLNWECVHAQRLHKADAPLFGSIRVERWGEDRPWEINWSVPGYCDRLIAGEWPDADAAIRAADEHVAAALSNYP